MIAFTSCKWELAKDMRKKVLFRLTLNCRALACNNHRPVAEWKLYNSKTVTLLLHPTKQSWGTFFSQSDNLERE